MDNKQTVQALWAAVNAQAWDALPGFFTPNATINWHNTNERFTPAEFTCANSEYPGDWAITIQRLETTETGVVSVVRVGLKGETPVYFHATSFFAFAGGKIAKLDEYWGDDGPAPAWRQEKKIGRPIEAP